MALTSKELDTNLNKKRLEHAGMALEALRNVIKNNPGEPSADWCRAIAGCRLTDDWLTDRPTNGRPNDQVTDGRRPMDQQADERSIS